MQEFLALGQAKGNSHHSSIASMCSSESIYTESIQDGDSEHSRARKFPSIKKTFSQTGSKATKGWDKQAHHSQSHQCSVCSAKPGKSRKLGTRRSLQKRSIEGTIEMERQGKQEALRRLSKNKQSQKGFALHKYR